MSDFGKGTVRGVRKRPFGSLQPTQATQPRMAPSQASKTVPAVTARLQLEQSLFQKHQEMEACRETHEKKKRRAEVLNLVKKLMNMQLEEKLKHDILTLPPAQASSAVHAHRESLESVLFALQDCHRIEPLAIELVKWILSRLLSHMCSAVVYDCERLGSSVHDLLFKCAALCERAHLAHTLIAQIGKLVCGASSVSLFDEAACDESPLYRRVIHIDTGDRDEVRARMLYTLLKLLNVLCCRADVVSSLSQRDECVLWMSILQTMQCKALTMEMRTRRESTNLLQRLIVADVGHVTVARLLVPKIFKLEDEIRSSEDSDERVRELRDMLNSLSRFDYSAERDDEHPCYDAALSFGKGDVLELVVSNDAHWWQARRLGWGAFADGEETRALLGSGVNGLELRVGLIPSELRQQEKSDAAPKPSESLSLFYEPVSRAWPRMLPPRPVVLIGPPGVGRNELKRRIMSLYPERFSTTVPHTSRPPRQHELPGADYHFVTRTQLQNMIARGEMLEFGEFRGNLYGTALSSVRDARIKATPLLTPHPLALQSLRTAEFTPVVVFVRPPRVDKFKETRDAHRDRCSRAPSVASTATGLSAVVPRAYTVEDCEQVVCAGRQLERQLAHLVDAVVENGELDVAVRQLCEIVDRIEREPAWVPSSWLERGRRASSREQ